MKVRGKRRWRSEGVGRTTNSRSSCDSTGFQRGEVRKRASEEDTRFNSRGRRSRMVYKRKEQSVRKEGGVERTSHRALTSQDSPLSSEAEAGQQQKS